jgi:hypothetical protein
VRKGEDAAGEEAEKPPLLVGRVAEVRRAGPCSTSEITSRWRAFVHDELTHIKEQRLRAM